MEKFEIRGIVYNARTKKWVSRRVSKVLYSSRKEALKAIAAGNIESCLNPYVEKISE